jgi:hypothetical protein
MVRRGGLIGVDEEDSLLEMEDDWTEDVEDEEVLVEDDDEVEEEEVLVVEEVEVEVEVEVVLPPGRLPVSN